MSELVRDGEVQPQPGPQAAFLSCEADVVFYGGAAGGGKTIALLMDPLRGIHKPDFRGIIFRRESTQIDTGGGLKDESEKLYPLVGGQLVTSPHIQWTFPSGARIDFRHLKLERNAKDYQGAQYDFIGFDELTHFLASQFLYLVGRNRSRAEGIDPWVRATMNPEHNSWVYDWVKPYLDEDGYADPDKAGGVRHYWMGDDDLPEWADADDVREGPEGMQIAPKSFAFVPADISDNKALLERDPGYLANLKTGRRVEQERLLGRSDKIGGCWTAKDTDGLFQHVTPRIIEAAPPNVRWVRYWDLADTDEEDADSKTAQTAGASLAVRYRQWSVCLREDCYWWKEGRAKGSCPVCDFAIWSKPMPILYIDHVCARRLEGGAKKRWIRRHAKSDTTAIPQIFEQEGGGTGKEVIGDYNRDVLPGHTVKGDSPTGDKADRAGTWVELGEQGRLFFVQGPWNSDLEDAMHRFPDKPRDRIDAISGGFGVAKKLARLPESGSSGTVVKSTASQKSTDIGKYFG